MIYLSRPSLWFPEDRLDNDELIERVEARYRGAPAEWPAIERGLRLVLGASGSVSRFKDVDGASRIGTTAVRASRKVLAAAGLEPDTLDMVVYGGISREYLEPAVACEVAGKLGIEATRAFDVVGACASQIVALATTYAWMIADARIERALVTSAEIARDEYVLDVQAYDELPLVGAGITVGDAASAWLLARTPFPGGCFRVVAVDTLARPRHWQLSQTPLVGRFTSQSSELLRLGGELGGAAIEALTRHGWSVDTVRQFFLHQPGRTIHEKMLDACAIPAAQAIDVHSRFGNTISVAVSTATWAWLDAHQPAPGDRFVLLACAAGLSGAIVLCEWQA